MKRKVLLALILALTISAISIGCGKGESENEVNKDEITVQESVTQKEYNTYPDVERPTAESNWGLTIGINGYEYVERIGFINYIETKTQEECEKLYEEYRDNYKESLKKSGYDLVIDEVKVQDGKIGDIVFVEKNDPTLLTSIESCLSEYVGHRDLVFQGTYAIKKDDSGVYNYLDLTNTVIPSVIKDVLGKEPDIELIQNQMNWFIDKMNENDSFDEVTQFNTEFWENDNEKYSVGIRKTAPNTLVVTYFVESKYLLDE